MDIQKEREAFEKLIDIEIIISEGFKFNPNINQYYHPDHTNHRLSYAYLMGAWMVWQEKAQAVPEWISVENTTPNKNGDYIVCIDGEPCSAFFKWVNDHWKEFKVGAGITGGIHGWWHTHLNVTHWMPLPDAPQEPEND